MEINIQMRYEVISDLAPTFIMYVMSYELRAPLIYYRYFMNNLIERFKFLFNLTVNLYKFR